MKVKKMQPFVEENLILLQGRFSKYGPLFNDIHTVLIFQRIIILFFGDNSSSISTYIIQEAQLLCLPIWTTGSTISQAEYTLRNIIVIGIIKIQTSNTFITTRLFVIIILKFYWKYFDHNDHPQVPNSAYKGKMEVLTHYAKKKKLFVNYRKYSGIK